MAVPSQASSDKLYFPTLDGLRFFAFLAVFIHHAPRSSWPILGALHDGGFAGVGIFLCLSAYLLTSILKRELELTGAISIGRFFVRRALRIWPLYYAFLGLLFGWQLVRHRLDASTASDFVQFGLFVENIGAGLKGYSRIPFTPHLWTISLEEQFYLVLPFALRTWLRTPAVAQLRLFAVWGVFLAARAGAVLFAMPHPFIWTSPFAADAIIVGTLLVLRGTTYNFEGWRGAVVLAIGLGATLSGAIFPPTHEIGWHQVVLYAAVAVGAGILCLAALRMKGLRWLSSPPLRYLGKISYGLYVFHFVGLFAGDPIARRLHLPSVVAPVIALAVTIALSAFSYELYERRFLAYKQRFESVKTRPL